MARHSLSLLRRHGGAALLVTLALAGMLLAAATVPHTHATPGLYNEEHDLGYLAALGGVAPLVQTAAAAALVVAIAAAPPTVAPVLATAPGRHPDPRAPPLR